MEDPILQQEISQDNEVYEQFPAKSDTTYSDEALEALLKEEEELINQEGQSRVMDITKMEVEKKNPKPVYVHYMPWFQSKEHDGYWGQHWTMTNQNPDFINGNGQRQIASYYYPLVGPYSTNDSDLQEYHLLMMKLAGIDGVIFDWYGSQDLLDFELIKQSTETFVSKLENLDMDFSIMYEDRVAASAVEKGIADNKVEAAQKDIRYIRDQYFSSPNYLKYSGNNLLFVFGPHYLTTESEWEQVFSVLPEDEKPEFLTLWAASDRAGVHSSGEFLWVAPDHLAAHEHYYETYAKEGGITVGGVYPGFKSFYTEGGWTEGINEWVIDEKQGQTFVETLNYSHHEMADFLQLITWNDFGEGTMIEPTEEYGFMYLQLLQQYTGVEFSASDFYIPVDLYKARKKYKGKRWAQKMLDRVYFHMKKKRFVRAKALLVAIDRFYS